MCATRVKVHYRRRMRTGRIEIAPHVYFVTSAVFHYVGPAFAVLLFSRVSVVGVAWLRIASAALSFCLFRRPWTFFFTAGPATRRLLVGFGVILAMMNCCFYYAISRLPLGTVGAIEFLGPILLAALGARSFRNTCALAACTAGVFALTQVRLSGDVAA